MNRRRTILAVLVGLLTFLVVGIVTTELLLEVVWPSLLVGIPVGAVAGVAAGALTWYWLGR